MATVVGDIAIQVGADISPLVRELGKAKAEVSGFGSSVSKGGVSMATLAKGAGIAAAGILTAGTALAAFTRGSLDAIDALSKQARVAGVSVASFQAMSMVAEEAGVSSEALSKSLVKMQDNITQLGRGGASQVAVFDQLGISFAEVGKLSADAQFELIAERISAISDPATKTSAALDVFGKAGADALLMMDGYGAAVKNASEFQTQFGLAVSDLDAANVEAANDAMGRVSIAVGALGTQFAVTLAPAIEATANAIANWLAGLTGAQAELNKLLGDAERAKVILGEETVNALLKSGWVTEDQVLKIDRLRAAYDGLGRDVTVAIRAIGDQIPVLLENGLDQMAIDLSEITGEMETVQGAFDRGAMSVEEYEKRMSDATAEANRLLDEAGKIDGVDMSGAVGQVNSLAKALAIASSVATGLRALLPGAKPATSATPLRHPGQSDSLPISPLAPQTSGRPEPAPTGIGGIDWGAPDTGSGGGGGGGGGSDRDFAEELKRMQEQFATKAELEQAQYEEQLIKLQEFRDKKLLSESQFNELETKMKADHEKNLADIEAERRAERLDAMAGAFGDLAGLMQSGNDKLFKIGQASAVAEAIVSGYSSAVAAWEKGMKIGGPGVAAAFTAASLAKTGALISSIASQTSRSSGGGRGGGGSGGDTSQPAAPQTYANITLNGDTFSRASVESLFDQINTGLKQGRVINLVRA